MPNTNGNNTLKWRVGQLEKGQEVIDKKLDILLTNDMPHMHEAQATLQTRINVLTAVNIGAIVLALVISRIM